MVTATPVVATKKGRTTMLDNDTNNVDDVPAVHRLELERLLYAMDTTTSTSPQVAASASQIRMRADLAQALWNKVKNGSNTSKKSQDHDLTALGRRVAQACQQAEEQVAALENDNDNNKHNKQVDAVVERVFFGNKPDESVASRIGDISGSSGSHDDADHPQTPPPPVPSSQRKNSNNNNNTTLNIPDLQKAQREQVEEAIHQMAARLKDQTAHLHSKLQSQTADLGQVETVTADQVDAVTAVAHDVTQHVAAGWSRTFQTWTLLLMIVGGFVFGLVTIQMVPKRQGACLFFCKKPTLASEFCRVLPNGQQECIPVPPVQSEEKTTKDDSAVSDIVKEEEDNMEEYDIGMDGQATPHIPSDDDNEEMRANVLLEAAARAAERIPNEADVFSADNLAGQSTTTGAAAAHENIPIYRGKPFSATDVRRAAGRGDVEALSEMLRIKPEWKDAADSNGWGPIHLAARKGFTKVVQLLMDAGCDPALETLNGRKALGIAMEKLGDDHPTTALLMTSVAANNNEQVVSYTPADVRRLAAIGDAVELAKVVEAEPGWVDEVDENGWAAIHLAARAGEVETTKLLLDKGCNVELETPSGRTPGMLAYERLGADHAVTQLLLQKADIPTYGGSPFAPSEIRRAAQEGDVELLEELLEIKPEWIDVGDVNGWTALHLAARAGYTDVVRFLLKAGSNSCLQTASGHDALEIAEDELDEHPVVDLLEEALAHHDC